METNEIYLKKLFSNVEEFENMLKVGNMHLKEIDEKIVIGHARIEENIVTTQKMVTDVKEGVDQLKMDFHKDRTKAVNDIEIII